MTVSSTPFVPCKARETSRALSRYRGVDRHSEIAPDSFFADTNLKIPAGGPNPSLTTWLCHWNLGAQAFETLERLSRADALVEP